MGRRACVGWRNGRTTAIALADQELTEQERRMLTLFSQGLGTREVAQKIHWSQRYVKYMLTEVMIKLGARNRTHAVALAIVHGYVQP